MTIFINALNAWRTSSFEDILKNEIKQLDVESLPLQQGLTQGSYVNADGLDVIILTLSDDDDFIYVKTALFYSGVVAGCNCADDPTPANETAEYCEVLIKINKKTANSNITLL